ncbi:MAG: NERD domain-containing protein [Sporichthyaceae bacterium]
MPEELATLPTPLNAGENYVLRKLLQVADPRWTIYVQPRIALMQPDFVLAHPEHGVWIVEVKDWSPTSYRRSETGRVEVLAASGWTAIEDPIEQARRYRRVIFDRCFARPREGFDTKGRVRALVVLPNHDDLAAVALLGSYEWVRVAGRSQLANLRALLDAPSDDPAPEMECLQRLQRAMGEPEFTSDQRLPLRKSAGAKNVAKNPSGAALRRVRGPAGSGKSIGVAARAVELARQGRSVLVLTFNTTLTHYLQDLCAREARDLGLTGWRQRIDFSHFHGLCRDIYNLVPKAERPSAEGEDGLVRAVAQLYGNRAEGLPVFDAILVDEGQDFELEWWTLLRHHLLRPGGEMLLVCDWSQNLYRRRDWMDERMSGFRGPWTELKGTYRMPIDLVPILEDFAAAHLIGQTLDLPTVEPDHPAKGAACMPTDRTWRNVHHSAVAWSVRRAVSDLLDRHPTLHPSDIVVLAEHGVGLSIVDELEIHGFDVAHLFTAAKGPERDRLKRRFWAGSPGIKGSTFHSFKGWEARAVIPVLTGSAKAAAELYVAITRVKADPYHRSACISVVNCVVDLNGFKERFTRELSVHEVPALAGQQSLSL